MSSMKKDIIMPVVVLTAICLVCSGALAATYQTTKPIIALAAAEEAEVARTKVYAGATEFEKYEGELPEGATEIYRVDGDEGFIITASTKGFGGNVIVMTGLTSAGEIVGVEILSMDKETSGLGTQIGQPDYLKKYVGQSSVDEVETISGATVTSSAFKKLMQKVVAMPQQLTGGAAK